METDETTANQTNGSPPGGIPDSDALDGRSSAVVPPNGSNPRSPLDLRRGGKKGNQNGATKGGMWALNRRRQRAFPIDHRTQEGKAELEIVRLLIEEYGGEDRVTTRQRILFALIGTNCGQLLQQKRARRLYIEKSKQSVREAAIKKGWSPEAVKRAVAMVGRHPKQLAELDAYMSPVISSLRSTLQALGPEPERQQERLEDILAKIAEEGENGEGEEG